jgi:hypothetical protein
MPLFFRCVTCNAKCNTFDEVREHYYDEEKNILEGNERDSHIFFERVQPLEYDWNNSKLIEK